MAVQFECVTTSTRSVTELFDLARNIDVHRESQARSRETATHGVVTGLIGLGEQVTWRARHFGMPFSMTSRITAFDAPNRFVDEQVRGPFRSFHHTHEFWPTDGGSVMIDRVVFVAPFGLLGRIVEKLVLRKYLRRLIEERGRFVASS